MVGRRRILTAFSALAALVPIGLGAPGDLRDPGDSEDWSGVWAAVGAWRASQPAADTATVRETADGLEDPLRLDLLEALLGEGAARRALAGRIR